MPGIDIHLPTLGLVVGSAAIDSINPCAIGVLILMISVIMGQKKRISKMLMLGGLYIFAIFITYLLAGFGLLFFLANIPLYVTEYLSIAVGLLIIIFGFLTPKMSCDSRDPWVMVSFGKLNISSPPFISP